MCCCQVVFAVTAAQWSQTHTVLTLVSKLCCAGRADYFGNLPNLAARVSALAKDVSELLLDAGLPPGDGRGLTVAYHAACSLQHGQKVMEAPRRLLAGAGYLVRTPAEQHLCCGSAGTYNILQPGIAGQLGDRKVANLARLGADVIATGNIGCAMQIGQRAATPVVHTVELLDWATGGPEPRAIAQFNERTPA